MVSRWSLVAIAVALLGCQPDLPGRASLIDAPHVIAVRSVPAEVDVTASDQTATVEALYVGRDGDADPSKLSWALCTERKPLATLGAVSVSCLAPSGAALEQLGSGASRTLTLPKDVCSVFGPTPPVPEPGQPPLRPADPDTTGGYYQPSRVMFGDSEYAVGMTRLAFCGLPSATQAQLSEFNRSYHANLNPEIEGVRLHHADGSDEEIDLTPDAAPIRVNRGERVDLHVSWADCSAPADCDGDCTPDAGAPAGDAGAPAGDTGADGGAAPSASAPETCTGSETYVVFDGLVRQIVSRREAMRVAWFATAGAFEHDRTGHTSEEAATPFSENTWTAPGEAGVVPMWFVLRDDRGGVGWQAVRVEVQ